MAGQQRWVPLESNPDVLNKYISKLGVNTSQWEFVDVYGLDPELLQMVPNYKDVVAVMLLFPITEKSKATPIGSEETDAKVYFVKQTIGNACGTVAIVHALANNEKPLQIIEDSSFAKFLAATKDLTPQKRADYLETDTNMGAAHDETAQEGQTTAPSAEEKVNTHFVAFIHSDGKLYEMNGSCDAPICHGATSSDSLLQDAVNVTKKFMERDPTELNFTLMALTKKG
ncbi:ubiquitin carboxyl-terminal hydrolase-like [Argopecten irradians]|uniref:ubiquitin carboxyl-terminal hydrolase-like n=1 Tax=Argopecten irradians TaxID=31199 RepID=UPI00371F761D